MKRCRPPTSGTTPITKSHSPRADLRRSTAGWPVIRARARFPTPSWISTSISRSRCRTTWAHAMGCAQPAAGLGFCAAARQVLGGGFLVDYRTGFPFAVTNDAGLVVGAGIGNAIPATFDLNMPSSAALCFTATGSPYAWGQQRDRPPQSHGGERDHRLAAVSAVFWR